MRPHREAVHAQFDPQASAYLTSPVHAAGADLAAARARLAHSASAHTQLLDVGCGAGHLSLTLAPLAARVVALDPSPGMLETVREAARSRGLAQIETCQAYATGLPFAAGSFDVVASRYSAHHWLDVPRALGEMRRVLKADGDLLLIDLLGEELPLLDTHLQSLELLRDPSHVRNYSASQWQALLQQCGFGSVGQQHWRTRLEFDSWVRRMRTPPALVAAIRQLQTGAPEEVQQGLQIEPDGSFSATTGLFWARAEPEG